MIYQVDLEDAKTRLVDLIEAALKGNKVLIRKDEEHTVQLIPLDMPRRNPTFGSAKGLIEMSDDFDASLEDFREYMP